MARIFNIEKNGLKNVIDEYQFNAYYKPHGWKVVSVVGGGATDVPTSPQDEIQQKNVNKMKKLSQKKTFDDNLIKGE